VWGGRVTRSKSSHVTSRDLTSGRCTRSDSRAPVPRGAVPSMEIVAFADSPPADLVIVSIDRINDEHDFCT